MFCFFSTEALACCVAYQILHSKALGILFIKLDRLVRPTVLEMLIHNLVSLPAQKQQSYVCQHRIAFTYMCVRRPTITLTHDVQAKAARCTPDTGDVLSWAFCS